MFVQRIQHLTPCRHQTVVQRPRGRGLPPRHQVAGGGVDDSHQMAGSCWRGNRSHSGRRVQRHHTPHASTRAFPHFAGIVTCRGEKGRNKGGGKERARRREKTDRKNRNKRMERKEDKNITRKRKNRRKKTERQMKECKYVDMFIGC